MALRDDAQPHAIQGPMGVHRDPERGGGNPASPGSTKVAWTLRQGGKITEVFDFAINPQGITRVESSRATVSSTKGGHYADDFGPGPSSITVRQIVASGKWESAGGGLVETFTLREDVQRFIKKIYRPATSPVNKGRVAVYFHDNHFDQGHEEKVLFPQNALTIQRAVDLQGVWLLELTMVGLEKNPFSDVQATPSTVGAGPGIGGVKKTTRYVVKRGDTLHKIVVKVAGKHASHTKRHQVLAHILRLNPQLKHRRKLKIDGKTVTAKPMRVVPGEVIRLPA